MPRLMLVRHGRPLVQPREPPSTWPFDPEVRLDIGRLGARLAQSGQAVVANTEQKAVDTAEALGIDTPLWMTADLRKVGKPWFDDPADHHVVGPGVSPSSSAPGVGAHRGRGLAFQRALEERLGDVDVVAMTHGTVMTAWLAAAGVVADGPSFWAELRRPDGWEVDVAAKGAWRVA